MIDGNITGLIQIKSDSTKNEIGENVPDSGSTKNEIGENVPNWVDAQSFTGFLDYSSGGAGRANYNAKIEETTHIFICDYAELDPLIKTENSRMVIDSGHYDVLFIDDVMNLHKHFEIYLKYTGGQ